MNIYNSESIWIYLNININKIKIKIKGCNNWLTNIILLVVLVLVLLEVL